jgi:hypothetical protein
VLLSVHVQPGAKKTALAGMHGGALKIRLVAQPIDGRANDCLIAYLAKLLDVSKSRLILQSGLASRDKRLRISAAQSAWVEERLGPVRDRATRANPGPQFQEPS